MNGIPIRNCTVSELLRRAARLFPDNDAVVSPERDVRWTFAELDARADRAAAGCRAAGLAPGDRAVVWATNIPEWLALQYGLARAGVVLVTANTALKLPEISHILKQSRVRCLFFGRGPGGNDFAATVARLGRADLPDLDLLVGLDGAAAAGSRSFPAFLEQGRGIDQAALEALAVTQHVDDVINMQYTSGTTGFPKGVMLTHRNIVENGAAISTVLRNGPADRLCLAVPLFHCFGCVIGTLATHAAGAAMVLNDVFDADAILDTVAAERCTTIYGVPTMFVAELAAQRRRPRDLSSLRAGLMAGATCPEQVIREVACDLHAPGIIVAYGLTEASPGVTMSHIDDDMEVRANTVGRALPGVEVRIVEPIALTDVRPGGTGELWTRGEHVMAGYDGEPEETRKAITRDGWLRTGDLAVERADGNYRIVGRIKDLIIRGGENISPLEVEDVLRRHPAVLDVAVFAVRSDFFGEEVAAAVRLEAGENVAAAELQEFARESLADHKVPSRIMYLDEFPLTGSGKVKRYLLRKMAEEA